MAKFAGYIGFVKNAELRPGVNIDIPDERFYKGDVLRRSIRYEKGLSVNDNVRSSNRISIVADPYAYEHFLAMKYVKWRGHCLEITEVDSSQYPRITLSLGGAYNGTTL